MVKERPPESICLKIDTIVIQNEKILVNHKFEWKGTPKELGEHIMRLKMR